MDEEDQRPDIPLTLRFREVYDDGRVVTLITFDGRGWKVEVFANIDSAISFAKENGIQVIN